MFLGCSAGKYVLFCVFGFHTIVWDTESGKMEVSTERAVMICETKHGPDVFEAIYPKGVDVEDTADICDSGRTICSCLPLGASGEK